MEVVLITLAVIAIAVGVAFFMGRSNQKAKNRKKDNAILHKDAKIDAMPDVADPLGRMRSKTEDELSSLSDPNGSCD